MREREREIRFPPFCGPRPIIWRDDSETRKQLQTRHRLRLHCTVLASTPEEKSVSDGNFSTS